MRRAARRDANEASIVSALERVGASVQRLNHEGVPDLVVGFRGATMLIEVKMPLGVKGGSANRVLTPDQARWWTAWRGSRPIVVRSVAEALTAIGCVVR